MINRVYYVEGLNHNLFSVGQFCDADLEVAFRKSTCFVRDLQGNDLLTGDSLNLPDHSWSGMPPFQLKSIHTTCSSSNTKTVYKHQDSRIMKAQELKTKTSAQTLIYKIFLQRYQVYQGILLASFQDDAKYEHVGQDTRSQGGKDDQDGRIKI
ncbi:hypothetical protein Tco_0380962 [Tanacetum coccineum]